MSDQPNRPALPFSSSVQRAQPISGIMTLDDVRMYLSEAGISLAGNGTSR